MAKKKVSRSRAQKTPRQKRNSTSWLLPLLLGAAVFLGLILLKGVFHDSGSDATLAINRGYTGPLGNFSIMYPDGWTKTESHEIGNKPADTTQEINTVTFSGNEGEVVVQWGQMGFGGGCPPEDYKDITLKNKVVRACNGVSSDGTMYWSGISNGANDDSLVEVRAKANIPTKINMTTIEAVLRTLQFN